MKFDTEEWSKSNQSDAPIKRSGSCLLTVLGPVPLPPNCYSAWPITDESSLEEVLDAQTRLET